MNTILKGSLQQHIQTWLDANAERLNQQRCMKKPRLFYFEEAEEAWCPVPDRIEHIISIDILDDGETQEISFKRVDMTDEEFAAIPEG